MIVPREVPSGLGSSGGSAVVDGVNYARPFDVRANNFLLRHWLGDLIYSRHGALEGVLSTGSSRGGDTGRPKRVLDLLKYLVGSGRCAFVLGGPGVGSLAHNLLRSYFRASFGGLGQPLAFGVGALVKVSKGFGPVHSVRCSRFGVRAGVNGRLLFLGVLALFLRSPAIVEVAGEEHLVTFRSGSHVGAAELRVVDLHVLFVLVEIIGQLSTLRSIYWCCRCCGRSKGVLLVGPVLRRPVELLDGRSRSSKH